MIVYGLGNNADKYLQTKHNAGRLFTELVAKKLGVSFTAKPGYYFVKSAPNNEDIWLLMSQGFMNESGLPLSNMVNFFKLFPDPKKLLLIAHDDSDQQTGRVKLLQGGGSSGHHGINSIYKHLIGCGITMEQVWRLKIGIRPAGNTQKSETFVLSKLGQTEITCIEQVADIFTQNLDLLNPDSISKLQTKINSL